MSKPKVIVILGQTATGKSDLAVSISLRLRSEQAKYGAEIISADSRQVYKGLDLGSGKITKKEMMGVRHHLLDVINPKKVFTVSEYQKKAIYAMDEIIKRGKMPIICGGTGFYVDAVVSGIIFPEVPPNIKLRKTLEKKTSIELFKILKSLDISRAKDIKNKNEQNNKVRLIRAIEIAKALGKVPKITQDSPVYEFIKIGLYLPDEILKERINRRLLKRMKLGMLAEAKKLHKQGLSWRRMEELGLEYRYQALYLQNKISKQEMLEKINTESFKYAKRQMTWFKRDKEVQWFNSLDKDLIEKILDII